MPKVKVGVVGEIYVKYSPLGNNDLQKFLESQDCEVNFPGLMGFVQYCIFNMGEDHVLYGGKLAMKMGTDQLLNWLDSVERSMLKAEADAGFYAPGPFKELVEKPEGIISLGAKMGEGWLLTAEMIELVQGGYGNIVCAQPFGCLPNHIVGKGMVNKIRAMYPSANITPIDYDPSATKVNQENRIKLMLAVAKERLNAPAEAKPLTAEEIAGGAPSLSTSEKLQKKQRSRTVQLFRCTVRLSYAPERLFLVILAVFLLIGGLAGEVHPQTFDGVRIHAGQDDRGVHVAALELGELLQSDSSRLILGGRAGQRDQDLIGVQAGIPAAEVVGLEGLDGLDGAGGDQVDLMVDAGQLLESIEQSGRGCAQQGTVLAGDDGAVRQLDGGSGCAAGALGHGVSLLFHGTVADSQTGLIQQQLQLEDLTVHVLADLVVTEGLEIAADDLVAGGLAAGFVVHDAVAGHVHAHIRGGLVGALACDELEHRVDHREDLDVAVVVDGGDAVGLQMEGSIMFTSFRSAVAAS